MSSVFVLTFAIASSPWQLVLHQLTYLRVMPSTTVFLLFTVRHCTQSGIYSTLFTISGKKSRKSTCTHTHTHIYTHTEHFTI